jgi:branched-chain amino acid transport system permease protein
VDPFTQSLFVFSSIYILLGWSLHVAFFANHLFFAQVALMMVAAYVTGELLVAGVPWVPAATLGVLSSVGAGLVLSVLGWRLRDFALAIATVAAAESMRLSISIFDISGGVQGLFGIPAAVTWREAVALVLLGALLLGYFHHSMASRRVLAVAADEDASRCFGTDPDRVKVGVTVLASVFAGAAGALYPGFVRFIEPTFFGFATLVAVLIYVIVGGMRSMWGAVAGVLLLWLLPTAYLTFVGQYRLIVLSTIAILVVLFMPAGLVPVLRDAWLRLAALLGRPPPAVARQKTVVERAEVD